MRKANPFDRKKVEKALFAVHKHGELQGRATRTFLRKMARRVCHAWELGYRDGAAGKPLIPPEDLPTLDNSPLGRDLFNRAYAAYSAGHNAGKEGG